MTYSCSDFTDTILDALRIEVPDESADSPSDQADLALEEIDRLRAIEKSAAAMLRALRATVPDLEVAYRYAETLYDADQADATLAMVRAKTTPQSTSR